MINVYLFSYDKQYIFGLDSLVCSARVISTGLTYECLVTIFIHTTLTIYHSSSQVKHIGLPFLKSFYHRLLVFLLDFLAKKLSFFQLFYSLIICLVPYSRQSADSITPHLWLSQNNCLCHLHIASIRPFTNLDNMAFLHCIINIMRQSLHELTKDCSSSIHTPGHNAYSDKLMSKVQKLNIQFQFN